MRSQSPNTQCTTCTHQRRLLGWMTLFSISLSSSSSNAFVITSSSSITSHSFILSTTDTKLTPLATHPQRRRVFSLNTKADNNDFDGGDDDDDDDDDDFQQGVNLDSFLTDDDEDVESIQMDGNIIKSLTVAQLKQQLRLRGLRVSGKKQELIDRLLAASSSKAAEVVSSSSSSSSTNKKKTKAQDLAEKNGKEFIDVSAYLVDEDEEAKQKQKQQEEEENVEIWGEKAQKVRVMSDLNDDSPVIDNLSRTKVEFTGYQNQKVQAYVVASRDALKGYLTGGLKEEDKEKSTKEQAQQKQQGSLKQLRDVQISRERAARVPMTPQQQSEIDEGIVEPDEKTTPYDNVIERDYSDWGVYTHTGAQISASEVQGVLFLSDVRGPFSKDSQALCDKIAHECQPCVIMAPDLFRGCPWEEESPSDINKQGQDYEQWRTQHTDERVNVDIRASAAVLRERYAVSSIAVFGTCFGGGRALEAAAGWIPTPSNTITTKDGKKIPYDPDVSPLTGPKLVDPSACIAWYPTRYNAEALFGKNRKVIPTDSSVAVMGIFAEEDVIPGATAEDAATLKFLLESDDRVKDNMIKVFPDQIHGFAHVGLGDREGDGVIGGADGEVASLLSTAFLETYTRMFLPTVGVPIKNEDVYEGMEDWTSIQMRKDIGNAQRDVRAEIAAAEKEYEDRFDEFDLDYSDVGTQLW